MIVKTGSKVAVIGRHAELKKKSKSKHKIGKNSSTKFAEMLTFLLYIPSFTEVMEEYFPNKKHFELLYHKFFKHNKLNAPPSSYDNTACG